VIGFALALRARFVTHNSLPVFELNARKGLSFVAPLNANPPAVTIGPALPLLPVFCFASGRPSVIVSRIRIQPDPVQASSQKNARRIREPQGQRLALPPG
jgi:hypothetical protein